MCVLRLGRHCALLGARPGPVLSRRTKCRQHIAGCIHGEPCDSVAKGLLNPESPSEARGIIRLDSPS